MCNQVTNDVHTQISVWLASSTIPPAPQKQEHWSSLVNQLNQQVRYIFKCKPKLSNMYLSTNYQPRRRLFILGNHSLARFLACSLTRSQLFCNIMKKASSSGDFTSLSHQLAISQLPHRNLIDISQTSHSHLIVNAQSSHSHLIVISQYAYSNKLFSYIMVFYLQKTFNQKVFSM